MDTADLIAAGVFVAISHVIAGLLHNRTTPGARPCAAFFGAALIHVAAVLSLDAPAALTWLGYLAGVLLAPLLFVAVVEYARLEPSGWSTWRWLLPAMVCLLAAWNMLLGLLGLVPDVLADIAAAPDPASRFRLINEARGGELLSTTLTSYAFLLAVVAVSARRFLAAPRAHADHGFVLLMIVLVMAADLCYSLTGVRLVGTSPISAVLLGCLVTGAVGLHRSRLFDARPVARSLLIDSVQDAILVLDAERRVVDHNAVAQTLVHALADPAGEPEALIGRRADQALPREFAALLQSTVHLRSELAVRMRNTEAWFEVDATPLRAHGRPVGHLIVARDISERRMVQNALEESRRSLEAANARLVEQSVTDPLTGLKNRRFLFQRLSEELNRHHRAGTSLGLLVLDLDHFKRVNDTHGHPVGDEALIQVAAVLQNAVRDCDVVARLGGEEFAVLAVNTDMQGLLQLAERLRHAVSASPVARETREPMTLTVSIGVAAAATDTLTPDGLFAEADSFLYLAKHRGRNRVESAASAGSSTEAAAAGSLRGAAR